ncbi:GDP-mannose mannosyl hydrolase [Halomonas sp. WWR20]
MWLEDDTYRTVIDSTPLVSIDFIVQNAQGKILLGKRLNRPAQGYWFVPGGRVLKNETLDRAFQRLSLNELGITFSRKQAKMLGVYEHFYEDNVFHSSSKGASTHYIVLGYWLILPHEQELAPPLSQHGEYHWWAPEEMKGSKVIHENTHAYIKELPCR